jgi:hypothetical protein
MTNVFRRCFTRFASVGSTVVLLSACVVAGESDEAELQDVEEQKARAAGDVAVLDSADALASGDTYTTRSTKPCTRFVSPAGNDERAGTSLANAWRTPSKAAGAARAGDVICFDAGTYAPLSVRNKQGTSTAPIVFRGIEGKARPVFTTADATRGTAIALRDVSYTEIRGLSARTSQKGIVCETCTRVRIEDNLVEDVGQEAIHVSRPRTYDGSNRFLGGPSEYIDILGNRVRRTGLQNADWGEGIYVGTGAFGGDDTHDVLVERNHLSDIKAEAIELKCFTYKTTVRRNLVHDVEHSFNGAIVVCAEPMNAPDMQFVIEDNRIHGVRSRQYSVAGINIGHGSGVVRNNVVWDVQGGKGVRILTTFGNPNARTVRLENNTVWATGGANISLHDGNNGTGANLRGSITLASNLTRDGSAGTRAATASAFRGPLAGSADAGQGAGSGFAVTSTAFAGFGADVATILR